MARLNDFVDDVRVDASDCPLPEVRQAILRACIEFCRYSRVWRTVHTITLANGTALYAIDVPDSGRSEDVIRAVYSDDSGVRRVLEKEPYSQVVIPSHTYDMTSPYWYAVPPAGADGVIYLHPVDGLDDDDNPICEVVSVNVPDRRARSVPDMLEQEWYEGVLHGAKWILTRTPGKSWYDTDAAAYNRTEFYKVANEAKREAMTEGWADQRTILPRFV